MKAASAWQKVARRIRVPLGFVFAAVFLVFARPSLRGALLSLLLVLPGLWLRGYSSGYVKKNEELTTTGPYGYTRNPLYLGSLLIALGFAGASGHLWLVALFLVLFLGIYLPTIRSEEQFLRSRFPAFALYVRTVPRLLPRPWRTHQPLAQPGHFRWQLYRQHREYNATIGAVALYAALLLRSLLPRFGL